MVASTYLPIPDSVEYLNGDILFCSLLQLLLLQFNHRDLGSQFYLIMNSFLYDLNSAAQDRERPI